MKYKYIAIEREYGSGGTKIARCLSEKLGIPCYGGEILEEVSREYEVPVDRIEQYEETVTNSLLYTMFALAQVQSGDPNMLTREGHIFAAEQAVIRRLAAESGKAIFIGHCAAEAFRGSGNVVKVFIHGEPADKKKRIIEEYHIAEDKAELTRKRFDKKRANYYYANTTKRWEDRDNYDIVLNSTTLGIDGCVAVLKGLF